jgi:hypothetical protein
VRVILFNEGEDRRAFDAAVVEATQAIIDDKTMIADSDPWFRSSPAEIEVGKSGRVRQRREKLFKEVALQRPG